MEENNQNSNGYTGEYGNSVEGGDGSSLYSYSYRENPQEATQSGDYHEDSAVQPESAAVESESEDTDRSAQEQSAEGWKDENAEKQPEMQWQNAGTGYNNTGNTTQYRNNRPPKSGGITTKKIAACAGFAILFGILAGICFQLVGYVSHNVLRFNNTISNGTLGYTTDGVNYSQAATGSVVGTADVSSIVENTMPSIVAITSTESGQDYSLFGQYIQGEETASSGSGFIVGKNATELLIATNNHVIDRANTISVQFIDDEVYQATAKGTDSSADLAVVAVKLSDIKNSTMKKIKIATLGDSSEVRVGEMAIAIGNALGYGQSVTVGYISAKNREIQETTETGESVNTMKVIQTDAAINPGNSGGALLNVRGEVIGINAAKIADSQVEGVGYAIPISEATPIMDELMNKEVLTEDEKGYLGISGKTVSEEAASFNMPNGVYVSQVAKGGAAQEAGILPGDIITGINEIQVTNMESLQEKVNSYKKGTSIKITVKRLANGEYEEEELEVVLQGSESLDKLPESTQEGASEKEGSGNQSPDNDSEEDGSGFGQFPFGFGN